MRRLLASDVLHQVLRIALPAIAIAASACADPAAPSGETNPVMAEATAATLAFRQISAGSSASCGVTSDDRAYCWGEGPPGNGTQSSSTRPVAVSGGLRFLQVTVGGSHKCGVATDNRAYCWGFNNDGKLGDGTAIQRNSPVLVAGGLRFRQVEAGDRHTCGVTTTEVAYCWGENRTGQLGDGTESVRRLKPYPVAGGLRFRRIVAASGHTCALATSRRAYCWGWGALGQIGDGKTFQRRSPRAVAGGREFTQVIAGGTHSCGVATDGRAYCWGENRSGELGDGTTTGRLVPTLVGNGRIFSGVSGGGLHTCGVTPANALYCWGSQIFGQTGNGVSGSGTPQPNPALVAGGRLYATVSGGTFHTCAVTTGSRAFCWGNNQTGELGDGTTTVRSTPVAVMGPS
jgi:alpha-tubulin suppressor-like RCC1 family protein